MIVVSQLGLLLTGLGVTVSICFYTLALLMAGVALKKYFCSGLTLPPGLQHFSFLSAAG